MEFAVKNNRNDHKCCKSGYERYRKENIQARGIQDLDQIRGSLKDQRPSTRNLIIRIHSLNTTWWSKPLSSGQNRSNDSQFFGVLIPNRI